jgi:hypothetical protein
MNALALAYVEFQTEENTQGAQQINERFWRAQFWTTRSNYDICGIPLQKAAVQRPWP